MQKWVKYTIALSVIFVVLCVVLVVLLKLYVPPELLSGVNMEYYMRYGYFGLFFITFLGGSFIPAGSPAAVGAAGMFGMETLPTILVAAVGYTLGTYLNYFLAQKLGRPYVERKMSKEAYDDISRWWNRWGYLLIFAFALLPILPFNFLALFCGLFGVNLLYFLLINFGSNLLNSYVFVVIGSSIGDWLGFI